AVDARALGVRKGTHKVTARAVDASAALRDPAARAAAANSVTWTVSAR
ncbi:hypothetical protein G3I40_13845, partial [Streptomyces sp. SID14478]|nr:hypothetical protein [Streptomyces sp. SID14478]